MHAEEYVRMAAVEGSMWWYRGLHANVLAALAPHLQGEATLLDAGCGTGGMLRAIGERFPQVRLQGLDLSEQACAFARERTAATIVQGSVDRLPYPDRSFDALISLDVLGYDIDLSAAVAGFLRVLKPGGHAVINLAAYQWMLSYHDRAVGQKKRFTRTEAVSLFRKHGFHVHYATYWNTLLFPMMVARRKLLPAPAASDVNPFPPILEKAFRGCLGAERLLMDRKAALPFGGSVLLVAQHPLP
jgi:SAM-dependent methyltransferase